VFILAVLAWTGFTCMALFMGIDKIFGMRVDEESEKLGMDISKHGVMETSASVGPITVDGEFTNV